MSSGAINGAGSVSPSEAQASMANAIASSSVALLDMALDMAAQLNAQLLSSLEAGGAPGVGGSFDAYG